MATLRTPLFGQTEQNLTADRLTQLKTHGMSSLRRGYESGLIGAEANYAAAREAGLRADGDAQSLAEADALRSKVGALQHKQSLYAPEVNRVEDVDGVGSALSYAAGQVGQGAASMQDPLLAGAALQGVGNVLSKGPGAMKAVGALAKGAGYLVPYGMNQRQMTGEAYNAMVNDPELMARTSAKERHLNANLYGGAAGLLDTVVPSMIAGKLAGNGLRQGMHQAGLLTRTAGGMAMEGGTELAQQIGQQQTLGYMNPNRDTSGDFSDNLNSFVGGAIGAGPMVFGGELADTSYRGVGHAANKVSEKAGQTVDLLSEKAAPGVATAKDKLGKVVDLFKGDDGNVTPSSVADKVKDAVKGKLDDLEAKAAERDIISGMPPDDLDTTNPEVFKQWLDATAPKRMEAVTSKIDALADSGDERADAIAEALRSPDDEVRANALEDGASHILEQDEWVKLDADMQARAKQAGRLASKFGQVAGRAAKAAGSAAVDFGKAVIDGARSGAKKNEQVDPFEQILADEALAEGKEYMDGLKQNAAKAQSYQRAKLMSEYMAAQAQSAAEGRGYNQSVEDAINVSPTSARRASAIRMPSRSPEVMTGFMRDIGLEIADLAENWHAGARDRKGAAQPSGPSSSLRNPADSKGQQYNGLKYNLNRIVRSMKLMYGDRAQQVVNELQAIDKNSAPELFDLMRDELATQLGPRAARHNAEVEREAQDAVLGAMGQDVEARLLDEGVNIRTGAGKAQLLSMVKAVDDGVAPPAAVRALEGLVGKEQLKAMRAVLRPAEASRDDLIDDGGVVNGEGISVDDDGEVTLNDQTDFDRALAETKAGKMRGARMVRFGKSSMKLDRGARGDVFASGKMTREQHLAAEDEFLQRVAAGESFKLPQALQRPALVKKGDTFTSTGEDAIEGMLARLEAEVGMDVSPAAMRDALHRDAAAARKAGDREAFDRIVAQGKALRARLDANDPALKAEARQFFTDRSENGKWGAKAMSVSEYMKREGYDPARKLSLYRDYLRQELAADAGNMTPKQRTAALAEIRKVGVAIVDVVDQKAGKTDALRLSPGERREVRQAADKYFDERYMAVAEQMTDAAPDQMSGGEVMDMAELGKRVYEFARTKGSEKAANEYISEAGVLVFKGTAKNKAGQNIPINVLAKDLVKWAKDQRETYDSGTTDQGRAAEKTERFGNTDKDMQYLQDLSAGITALMDSGAVDRKVMPYKLNQFGKAEHFGQSFTGALDGVPPSLPLVTTTVYGLQKRAEGRQKHRKDPSPSELRRQRVEDEKQKAKEWDSDFFVAGSEFNPDPDPVDGVDAEAKFSADADAAFKDVRTRTRAQGRDARKMPLPQNEVPLTAASRAQQRAAEIVRHFMPQDRNEALEDKVVGGVPKATADERYEAGADAVMQRMKVARQDKKDGGGAQYAIPVVVALTDENIARMDVTAEQAKALAAMRAEAVELIDNSDLNKTLKAKFGTPAAKGVGASLGKPSGVGKVKLTGTSVYLAKDQAKSDRANKFIGRGSAASSTAQYAKDWGENANTGSYTADDVVFVSAEGNRTGRVLPDFAELNRAMSAGATLVTDSKANRDRPYNVGEREVASHLAKHGYIEVEPGTWRAQRHGSRIELLAGKVAGAISGERRVAGALGRQAFDAVVALQARGVPRDDAMKHPTVVAELAQLVAMKMRGDAGAAQALTALTHNVDQVYSLLSDPDLTAAVESRLRAGGMTVKDMAKEFAASTVPEQFRAIAKAVGQIAGHVTVAHDSTMTVKDGDGYYEPARDRIGVREGAPNKASVVLHEAVHAATVKAMHKDADLHAAVYKLMAHVVGKDSGLQQAYGLSDTFEFLAEGMSNEGFQKRLAAIPASGAVAKYLGANVANAWDAFVGLVRKALGMPPGSETALSQLIELGGRAMVVAKKSGAVTGREVKATYERELIPAATANRLIDELAAHANVGDGVRDTVRGLKASVGQGTDHSGALLVASVKQLLDRGVTIKDQNDIARVFDVAAAEIERLGMRRPRRLKLNAQQPSNKTSTQAERDAAVAEIKKTLGDHITTRFEALTGYSGAYLDQEAAIVISLTPAAGTLQTAYHEAMHAFVAKLVKGNDKAKRVLESLANHEPTMERVRALLKDYPAALAQLTDGEERIAYIYQFWRAGLLDLPAVPGTTMLQKLRRFFRGILGRVSDLERSGDVLGAFARGSYAGNPSVAGKVLAKTLAQGTWGPKTLRKMDGLAQKLAAWTYTSQSILLSSDSQTAQKLGNILWTNPGDEDAAGAGEGYLNARERMAKRYTNEFSRIVAGLSERDHKDVIGLLQAEADPAGIAYQPHREAVEKIRALLQRFRKYMVEEKGMKIGDRGPLYFPRVWSPHALTEKKAEFLAMMRANHPTYDAEAVYNAVLSKFEQNTEDSLHGREIEDDDAVLKPTQNAGNERILSFITGEQAQPFLEQSLVGTLTRYFHEGARAAEYTSRFGQTGRKLELALSRIHAELRVAGKKRRDDGELADQDAETKWVERQMRDVTNAVSAIEGTLGRDISDGWRKTNSWVTVYQNVRLLPMALFSSVVDPLGLMARGATMGEAYDAFLRGMSEVISNWGEMITGNKKEKQVDKWERMAMAVGSVDAAVFNHHVSDEYASVFMSAGAKKINDFMFKANGMEAWNRGMRVAATRSAALFIQRHKSLPDTHSARWLTEIGLTPADIHTDADGELITDKHVLAAQLGISKDEAAKQVEKIHIAINRWVQGAVLTPNAAQRPAWGSDPHYSMFFHLKQFAYSFHQTLIKRAVKELEYGNLAPLGAFVWYIPVMIAADITKGLIQGGGQLPGHMKGMDLGDWVAHGAERAGLLGVGQMGVDAGQDLASIGGPAVEQVIDAFSDPLERTMIKAAPAHSLYAEALR